MGTAEDPHGYCYAKNPPFTLAVNFGDKSSVVDLGDYIDTVYKYAIGIAGVVAAVVMMIGGMLYLTAADSDRISRGKQFIVDALTGLVIILGAYLMLNTINPDLVSLSLPKVPVLKKTRFTTCAETELCMPCGQSYVVLVPKGYKGATFTCDMVKKRAEVTAEDTNTKDISGTCIGKGCYFLNPGGCLDTTYRCTKSSATVTADPACPPIAEAAPSSGTTSASGGSGAATGGAAASGSGSTTPTPPAYVCRRCKSHGSSCGRTGPNDECCAGFCADTLTGDECSAGSNGDTCDNNNECRSGLCQTRLGNSCSAGLTGNACASDSECRANHACLQSSGLYICSPKLVGGYCIDAGDCPAGSKCDNYRCLEPGQTSFSNCTAGSCPPARPFCMTNFQRKICSSKGPGSICKPSNGNNDCMATPTSKGFCVSDGMGLSGDIGLCTDGSAGMRCDGNSDCDKNHCYRSGDYGFCVTGDVGSTCDNSDDCEAAKGLTCQDGRCLAGGRSAS